MKVALVLCAIVGLSLAAPQFQHDEYSLQQDFQDFINLIPVAKLKQISETYLKNDKEVQQVVKYLQGKEWAALVAEVGNKPEVIAFENWLRKAGIDIDKVIQWIHDLIAGAKPISEDTPTVETFGMRQYVDEMLAALPLKDMLVLLNKKLETSKDFQEFYKEISSPQAQKLVKEVAALKEVQRIKAQLISMGIDVQKVIDLIKAFLGWSYKSHEAATFTLQQDFQDFINLIPVAKMKEISDRYLKNDKEVQQVVKYLQGKEWAALVAEVAKKPEVIAFEEYLQKAGIDIKKVIKWIHDLIAGAKPISEDTPTVETFGMRQYIDEMLATLPLKDLLVLLNKKLETSKDFQQFYKEISSPQAQKLAKEVAALKEVQRLKAELISMGIDVQKVIDLIKAFLGWSYKSHEAATFTLQQDFQDFINLIPVAKLKEISDRYLKNDKEVQQVVKYLQSKEWAALVAEVGNKPAVIAFEEYLQKAGIDIKKVIKWIHDLIAGAKPIAEDTPTVETFGMRQYMDEIKAALPLKDMLLLLNKKLETSKDFQQFYKEISSPEAQKLAKEVAALKEVQRLKAELISMGIDVQKVIDLIKAFLGWE